jgi:hypothetical protein
MTWSSLTSTRNISRYPANVNQFRKLLWQILSFWSCTHLDEYSVTCPQNYGLGNVNTRLLTLHNQIHHYEQMQMSIHSSSTTFWYRALFLAMHLWCKSEPACTQMLFQTRTIPSQTLWHHILQTRSHQIK